MGRPVVNSNGNYRKGIHKTRKDKRMFSNTAGMTHELNMRRNPMRGGYRL